MNKPLLKVLIVDDEEPIRLNLEIFLRDENFDIYAVETGKEAIKVASKIKIDLGIIDMRLPDTDGQALILELHKLFPEMKFLIHTGSIDYLLPRQLVDLGITEEQVIHKPINDMKSLVDIIHEIASEK